MGHLHTFIATEGSWLTKEEEPSVQGCSAESLFNYFPLLHGQYCTKGLCAVGTLLHPSLRTSLSNAPLIGLLRGPFSVKDEINWLPSLSLISPTRHGGMVINVQWRRRRRREKKFMERRGSGKVNPQRIMCLLCSFRGKFN